VDLLVDLLRIHSERNIRLFWLEGISDEFLEKVYAASTCLIAASEGEGFGLPLIEAAQHMKPIIARDIPIFREVAGVHASYFSGLTPGSLASAVTQWLKLDKQSLAPQSTNMPWLTWKQATQNLLDVAINGQWYQEWMPDTAKRFFGSDSRLGTQVGIREGSNMLTTGKNGYLIFGPYIPLSIGRHTVVIYGEVGEKGIAGASMDVASKQGSLTHGGVLLSEREVNGIVASLEITLDEKCTDLEVRVFVTDQSDLLVSKIAITPFVDEVLDNLPALNVIVEDDIKTEAVVKVKAVVETVVEKIAVKAVVETKILLVEKIVETPKISDVKSSQIIIENKSHKRKKIKQAW
jgi:Glycosyl transferases group 1